jgi:hypothetical protein
MADLDGKNCFDAENIVSFCTCIPSKACQISVCEALGRPFFDNFEV